MTIHNTFQKNLYAWEDYGSKIYQVDLQNDGITSFFPVLNPVMTKSFRGLLGGSNRP